MTEKFITKRPHKKSRAGCQTCKARKVKCDEGQPICGYCSLRKLSCRYVPGQQLAKSNPPSPVDSGEVHSGGLIRYSSPNRSGSGDENFFATWDITNNPSPIVLTSTRRLSATDLKLMHHWSTFTWKTIGAGLESDFQDVIRLKLPELAFESEFLMNGLLGISSLHMQNLLPASPEQRRQTDLYRAKAIRGFREALIKLDPFSKIYQAALMQSLMIVILCSQDYASDEDDLVVVQWVTLYRGLSAIINMRTLPDKTGFAQLTPDLAPVFRRELTPLKSTPVIPSILLDMMASVSPMEPDYAGMEYYCTVLDALGLLYASLRQDGLGPPLFIRVVSWCSYCPNEFSAFARERRPRALIILAYYLCFVKLIPNIWWIQGIPDRDIAGIRRIIGSKWWCYLGTPFQALEMNDAREIAALILK